MDPTEQIERWREDVDARLSRLSAARERRHTEREALRTLRARSGAVEVAQTLAQHVAQSVQSQAHAKIAEIVTLCLAIFDEPYTFRIHFERKRGRTEARLVFSRGGQEVDPLSASGLGVVDVAAFALRLACLVLSRPPLRRLMVLDEPFKFLSDGYREKIRELLETLARDLGVQFIIVTHDPQLTCGTVVDLVDLG